MRCWLEIVNDKVNGEYVLIKQRHATIAGAYVKYKPSKGSEITFAPARDPDENCTL